VVAIEYK